MDDHVGAHAVRNLIDLSLQEGLDPALFFAPGRLDWRDWARTNRRLDWDRYCSLVERYTEHLGGVGGCEELGDQLPSASPTLTRVLGPDHTMPQLYRLLAQMVPEIWRCVTARVSDAPSGSFLFELDIAPANRGLLPLMSLFAGILRSAPRRLDQLPSQVEVLDISPRMGVWLVTPPRPRARPPGADGAFSAAWITMMKTSSREAVALFEELDRDRMASRVDRVRARWRAGTGRL